ncbi:MAG: ferrous iron transport protein B [Solirubrobacterales bacterium]
MSPAATSPPEAPADAAGVTAEPGCIALVGHPNVGKSVLFKRLTGRYVTVSNFPGTTVEISRGAARSLPGAIVDTPGVVAIPGRGEDEKATVGVLLEEPLRALVQVGDAKSMRRTLLLTLQLAELGLPLVLALNMMDEAGNAGVSVDCEALAERLGIGVVATVATRGKGVPGLEAAIESASRADLRLTYPAPIESALARIAPLLPGAGIAPRALGLLWVSGDDAVERLLAQRLPAADMELLRAIRAPLAAALGCRVAVAIQDARLARAEQLAAAVVEEREERPGWTATLTRLTTHRLWGWPILALALYGMYWFVGVFGAGRLVGLLEEDLFGSIVNPWLTRAVAELSPSAFLAELLVGEYGLWTMGMTYALALILPIVTTFFLAFSLLEDSGYLARLTVVSNRLFTRLGLNGKAALPMVLGLGCVTMATLTTRILDSRRDRLLAIFLLALAVPCSAQLGVILGMLGSLSFAATLIWGAVVATVLLVVGALAARLVPGERSTLLLELPPLRVPVASNVVVKTLARLEWYLKEVVPLFLLGTAVLFALDKSGALPWLIGAAEPLVTGWLGLPEAAGEAFLLGFLRRDFGATGLFMMHQSNQLSAEQVVVAMVTITLFVPCVASVLIIARERGARVAAAITAIVFPVAFLVGGILHRALLLSGWG